MADAPLSFRVHAVAGMLVFMIWPFTRLVHAFSAPLGYVFRPYVVYRDRGPHRREDHAPAAAGRRSARSSGGIETSPHMLTDHGGSAMKHLINLSDLIGVAPESTVSRTVLREEGSRVVLFAFDSGQELTEHTAAVPILLQVLDGLLRVGADGDQIELSPGGLVRTSAHECHTRSLPCSPHECS